MGFEHIQEFEQFCGQEEVPLDVQQGIGLELIQGGAGNFTGAGCLEMQM
jgi:hypothetical protein